MSLRYIGSGAHNILNYATPEAESVAGPSNISLEPLAIKLSRAANVIF